MLRVEENIPPVGENALLIGRNVRQAGENALLIGQNVRHGWRECTSD